MEIDFLTDGNNKHYLQTMVEEKIAGHKVELYDSIEELPIVRFHKYQKYLLIESGIGDDLSAFDLRAEKIRQYILKDKKEKALQELSNMRQNVHFVQNEVEIKNKALACLVSKIDGFPFDDLSDAGLQKVIDILADSPRGLLGRLFMRLKKKVDEELTQYFPTLFNSSEVKEYYNLLRRRTLAILQNIIAGKDVIETPEVDQLTGELITYSNPGIFNGYQSAEIQHDKNFENLCLMLSEQCNVQPKNYTVMEFYNAFEFLQERAKEQNKRR